MAGQKRKREAGAQAGGGQGGEGGKKRRGGGGGGGGSNPKYGSKPGNTQATIESGDAGIFLSFDMGRDGKCLAEAKDLLCQYSGVSPDNHLNASNGKDDDEDAIDEDEDIEAAVARELAGMKSESKSEPFQAIRMDIPCVAFIKTLPPHNPIDLVQKICADALHNPSQRKSRWIKRMTPITSIRKTSRETALSELISEVLQPHFHAPYQKPLKFAIRTQIRWAGEKFKREDVIREVAAGVGEMHSVDLKGYDKLIIVDVCRHVVGMSVVGREFEEYRRFNVAELYDPTPVPAAKGKEEKSEEKVEETAANAGEGNGKSEKSAAAISGEEFESKEGVAKEAEATEKAPESAEKA